MGALHRLMSFQAGALSAVPYLIALAVAALVVGWAATRTFRSRSQIGRSISV